LQVYEKEGGLKWKRMERKIMAIESGILERSNRE
jgi:hypothetical protein